MYMYNIILLTYIFYNKYLKDTRHGIVSETRLDTCPWEKTGWEDSFRQNNRKGTLQNKSKRGFLEGEP